ncbi:translation initiation factor IF-2-like [Prionailurus bengalensis]|uniref:translation initiation factor IF-2-like n=1 Tax=Prionailurus bengalensis TaxID=37029 RepID=UPI001CA88789|nr:translation initiation factor IF-2-like [Prionailurus bengalensis]
MSPHTWAERQYPAAAHARPGIRLVSPQAAHRTGPVRVPFSLSIPRVSLWEPGSFAHLHLPGTARRPLPPLHCTSGVRREPCPVCAKRHQNPSRTRDRVGVNPSGHYLGPRAWQPGCRSLRATSPSGGEQRDPAPAARLPGRHKWQQFQHRGPGRARRPQPGRGAGLPGRPRGGAPSEGGCGARGEAPPPPLPPPLFTSAAKVTAPRRQPSRAGWVPALSAGGERSPDAGQPHHTRRMRNRAAQATAVAAAVHRPPRQPAARARSPPPPSPPPGWPAPAAAASAPGRGDQPSARRRRGAGPCARLGGGRRGGHVGRAAGGAGAPRPPRRPPSRPGPAGAHPARPPVRAPRAAWGPAQSGERQPEGQGGRADGGMQGWMESRAAGAFHHVPADSADSARAADD